jgi:predicted regulator of amino acid metabolism with ACT domain
MAAKVINFHSPDGKNTYELTFTRDSVEATERAGFQIGQYTQMTNLLSNSRALFYGAFIARNRGIKRKVVDEMFAHIDEKEELMATLLEMFKSLLATDTEDKTAKNATWEIV